MFRHRSQFLHLEMEYLKRDWLKMEQQLKPECSCAKLKLPVSEDILGFEYLAVSKVLNSNCRSCCAEKERRCTADTSSATSCSCSTSAYACGGCTTSAKPTSAPCHTSTTPSATIEASKRGACLSRSSSELRSEGRTRVRTLLWQSFCLNN